jgi:hypothetical protein
VQRSAERNSGLNIYWEGPGTPKTIKNKQNLQRV